MKLFTIISIFAFSVAPSLYAQDDSISIEQDVQTTEVEERFHKQINKLKERVMKIARGKFDDSYVAVPENKWMVLINSKVGYNKYNLNVPFPQNDDYDEDILEGFKDFDYLSKYRFRLHQSSRSVAVGLAFGTLSARYTFNIDKNTEQQFKMESLGSKFGFMIDYRHCKKMKGTQYDALNGLICRIFDPWCEVLSTNDILEHCTTDIPSERNDFTTTHVQCHYVFNSRRFSYSAGRSATRIQKKSAGSFLVIADYYQNFAKFEDCLLLANNEKYTIHKGAIGGGYAYNYTPNGGKVLLHASFIPTITLFSKANYNNDPVFTPDDPNCSDYDAYIYDYKKSCENINKMVDAPHKTTLNCTARVSATWNINSHYVLSAFGSYQFSDFANKSGYSVKEHNLNGLLLLGYRF